MLAALFLPFAVNAQLSAIYQFSTGIDNTQWYTLTSDSTVLKVGSNNDSYATPVTDIGFTFNFAGVDYTQFSANSDGTVRLGSTVIGTGYYTTPFSATNANNNSPKICGLGCDGYLVAATADSPADYIAYQVFGSDGDHVLVIEISTGTYSSATRNNHYTFQIQLAEVDNSVTLIYSPAAPAAGPAVSYQLGACTSASDIVLFNVANNTMSTYTSGTSTNNASGTWPAPGRYYTITPNPNACYPVTGLTASNITATGATLTWADTNNTGATYSVYNGETLLASGITGNTYDVTGLSANASYVFYVIANCSGDNASNAANVSIHSACGPTSLPWTCGFEENEILSTSAATALPWCSERYVSPSATSGTTYPYSNNTNAHTGSRSLYFYGTTGSAYPDTMAIILPEIDVTNYPMSGNRVTFWSKMGTASDSKNVYVGTLTDPADISTFTLVQSVTVSGTTHSKYSVPLANATGAYVAFIVLKGSGSLYIDDVTFEEMPSCVEVTNLAVTDVTSSSVSLSWTDAVNTGASYTIYNMADSSVAGTTSGTTYTVDNLNSNTVYTFGVQTNCTSGDAAIMTISQRTSCSPEALPFSETFDASLSSDPCWAGATGVTAEEALNGTALTLTANSQWTYTSSESNGIPAGHYRVNIYGTSCKKWMITPEIDLTNATSPLLTFDAAFTAYSASSTDPASGFENNASQAFMILVSTNGGQTWTTASNIGLTSIASSTYVPQFVSLSAYAGQTVRIAFYAQSTVSGGDNNLHVDNILVEESTGNLCLPVSMLTASNVTDNSATLTWSGEASSYNVYTIAGGDTTLYQNVTTQSLDLTGLTAMTTYTYGVTSVCNGDESIMTTVTFATACTALTLPYTETFEATSNTINCWTVDGTGSWTIATGDYSATTGAYEGSQNAKIVHGTTGAVTKFVSPTLDGVQSGLVLDFAYVLRAWSGDVDELRVYGRAAADSAWQMYGEFTDATGTWTTETVVIPGTVYQVAFEYTDNYGYGLGVDSVVFTVMTGDYCYQVSNLAAGNITANSLTLTWSDDNNTGATYTIYNMADNSVVATGVTTTSYDVTGLTGMTGYTFGVEANCSATNASAIATVTVATTCAGETCNITIVGVDSYDDGWNGNTINVMQAGVVVGSFTFSTGSSYTQTFSVCSSAPVEFSWETGSYADETSFEIIDGGGAVVHTVADGSSLTDGVFFTLNDACPSCITPAITVSNVTTNSVTINWTGSAASYDIYNGTTFVANVTTNTYTFSGLTLATDYVFGVQAICSATDSSAMATVAVSTDCEDVTTLPYNEGFENGLGCWRTINASTDGQPWTVNNCSGLSSTNPHGGAYVASSWSWSGSAMHANAWLISPKFVLPNTTDSISFSWWDITSTTYPDHYSVVLSTTTHDTAAFTTVVYPNTTPAGDWTMRTIDLTPYAGQSVYIAFHHVDYDMNYLLIDDIALYQGAYIPPAPDSLTVIFAVNDATMGTTVPAPGTYQYLMGDTVAFHPEANTGYHFTNWVMSAGGQTDTLAANYVSVYFIVNGVMMSYGTVTMTALFEADSTPVTDSLTINLSINNPALGSINPLPGTYHVALNDSLVLTATPNPGVTFDGWKISVGTQTMGTIPINPFTFPVNPNNIAFGEMNVVAMFSDSTSAPDSMTVIINTADATMGTTNPAPGTYNFAVGSQTFVTAIPNDGYQLLYWIESMTVGDMTVTDTLIADTIIVNVIPIMAGITSSLTAYFEAIPVQPCETPTNLHASAFDAHSITIGWNTNGNATSWNIHYRVEGGEWNNASATTNTYVINGLEAETVYEIEVQADCGNGNLSDWSAPIHISTAYDGIENRLENSVSLYPNPAKEYVDIRVDGDLNVKMMEVYDVYGKLINTVTVTENPTRINVSSLANGMYFVRVSTEAGMVTKTFIKK